jgi:hypothetical protein
MPPQETGTPNALIAADMSAVAPFTLAYQSGADRRLHQRQWLGVTSLTLWVVTIVAAASCFVAATQASGWDGLGWLVAAFLVSWVGCGLGALFAAIGAFPRRRRHRFALTGLILNLLTGLGPITVIWVGSMLR